MTKVKGEFQLFHQRTNVTRHMIHVFAYFVAIDFESVEMFALPDALALTVEDIVIDPELRQVDCGP